MTVLQLVSELA